MCVCEGIREEMTGTDGGREGGTEGRREGRTEGERDRGTEGEMGDGGTEGGREGVACSSLSVSHQK